MNRNSYIQDFVRHYLRHKWCWWAFWLIYTGALIPAATVQVKGAGKGALTGQQQIGSQQLSGGAVGGAIDWRSSG